MYRIFDDAATTQSRTNPARPEDANSKHIKRPYLPAAVARGVATGFGDVQRTDSKSSVRDGAKGEIWEAWSDEVDEQTWTIDIRV
jgi:hypothetical protein